MHTHLDPLLTSFHRDGFPLVPGPIAPATIARLRELGDAVFGDPVVRKVSVR